MKDLRELLPFVKGGMVSHRDTLEKYSSEDNLFEELFEHLYPAKDNFYVDLTINTEYGNRDIYLNPVVEIFDHSRYDGDIKEGAILYLTYGDHEDAYLDTSEYGIDTISITLPEGMKIADWKDEILVLLSHELRALNSFIGFYFDRPYSFLFSTRWEMLKEIIKTYEKNHPIQDPVYLVDTHYDDLVLGYVEKGDWDNPEKDTVTFGILKSKHSKKMGLPDWKNGPQLFKDKSHLRLATKEDFIRIGHSYEGINFPQKEEI